MFKIIRLSQFKLNESENLAKYLVMKKSDILDADTTSEDVLKIMTNVNLLETILEEDCDLVVSSKDSKGNTWESYEVYSNRSLGLLTIDKEGDLDAPKYGSLDGDLITDYERDLKYPYLLIFKNNNLQYLIDDSLTVFELVDGYDTELEDTERYEIFENLPTFILTTITKHIFEKSGAKYTKEIIYDTKQVIMTPDNFEDLGEAFKDNVETMKNIFGDDLSNIFNYSINDFKWNDALEHLNEKNWQHIKHHFNITSESELTDLINLNEHSDADVLKDIFRRVTARCQEYKEANACYKEALTAFTNGLNATYDKGSFYIPLDTFAIYATRMKVYTETDLNIILGIGQIEFNLDQGFYGDFDKDVAEYYNDQIAEELKENNIQ